MTTMNVKTNVISFHPYRNILIFKNELKMRQISYDEWAKYCDPNGIYREFVVNNKSKICLYFGDKNMNIDWDKRSDT